MRKIAFVVFVIAMAFMVLVGCGKPGNEMVGKFVSDKNSGGSSQVLEIKGDGTAEFYWLSKDGHVTDHGGNHFDKWEIESQKTASAKESDVKELVLTTQAALGSKYSLRFPIVDKDTLKQPGEDSAFGPRLLKRVK